MKVDGFPIEFGWFAVEVISYTGVPLIEVGAFDNESAAMKAAEKALTDQPRGGLSCPRVRIEAYPTAGLLPPVALREFRYADGIEDLSYGWYVPARYWQEAMA